MGEEKPAFPARLVWLHGLVCGFSIPSAMGIGVSARADAEPTVGPIAGAIIQWAVTIGWLLLTALLLRWFCNRQWVRDWFAASPAWKP